MNRRGRRRAEAQQRAQEARLRKGSGVTDHLVDSWEKAAVMVCEVIDEAQRQGVQIFLRPTTVPSPHGPTGPIEIARSDDGRSLVITLFDVPENLRREFMVKLAAIGGVQIIREERA
jgi:hypothetical protein